MEIRDVGAFLDYWDGFRSRTTRVVDRIPEDRYDWAPREGAWTFADLVRHLASIERWMFTENAFRRPSRYPGCGPELADGPAVVRGYMDRLHRESLELLGTLGPDDLEARCVTPSGSEITVWKWLRAMVEHEAHHRGQIYLMLGELGVPTPPLYGLTAEQVAERSRP